MIVAGLLVFLAVGAMGIARITGYNGTTHSTHSTHSSPFRLDVPGYHLQGPGSRLFLFGLLVGAVTMLGLSAMVAGLGRGFRRRPAARQLLTDSLQQTSALQDQNDQLIPELTIQPRKGDASCPSQPVLPS
jgi:ABC-type Na+ efflux pump permease subunit